MKDITRNGILAQHILRNADQFFGEVFEEVSKETKPSRALRNEPKAKKAFEAPRRKKFDDHDD